MWSVNSQRGPVSMSQPCIDFPMKLLIKPTPWHFSAHSLLGYKINSYSASSLFLALPPHKYFLSRLFFFFFPLFVLVWFHVSLFIHLAFFCFLFDIGSTLCIQWNSPCSPGWPETYFCLHSWLLIGKNYHILPHPFRDGDLETWLGVMREWRNNTHRLNSWDRVGGALCWRSGRVLVISSWTRKQA